MASKHALSVFVFQASADPWARKEASLRIYSGPLRLCMHVLLVTGSYPPDVCGVGDYTARLRMALELRGARVSVASTPHEGVDLSLPGWEIRHVPMILRFFRCCRADLIHFMYPTRGVRTRISPTLIPWMTTKPSVCGLHEFRMTAPARKAASIFLTSGCRRIVVTTPMERKVLLRWAPWLRRRIHVIPIASTISVPPAEVMDLPSDPLRLSFFGFLYPEKGIDTLIHAAAHLRTMGKNVEVEIIGSQPPDQEDFYRRMRRLISSLGLSEVVHFRGRLSDVDVVSKLRLSHACVLPFIGGISERHTTVHTVLEAGVPCISTWGPDVPSGMRDGSEVLLVPPRDSAALVQAVLRLHNDSRFRRSLARGGAAWAHSRTWDGVAERFLGVYEEVLNKSTHGSRPSTQ